jgi:drug/metabolite transporter (DMT)-like permease
MSSIPAVVALMSWILLKERIGLRIWASVACGALGIGLLSLAHPDAAPGTHAPAARAWLGNALIFCAVLCEGFYSVIGKKLTAVLSPKRISAVINLWGFALMTPCGLYLALDFDFGAVRSGTWALLVFYALTASVGSVWLWMTGLKSVPAAQAGVFSVMLPVSAALTGVLALGERLSGMQAVAFALALAGILLATLPARRAAPAPAIL